MAQTLTYAQALTIAIDSVQDEAVKEKLTQLSAQLSKKRSTEYKVSEKTKAEAEKVLAALSTMEEPVTVGELRKQSPEIADWSPQKITGLLTKTLAKCVTAEKQGKKTLYSVK